MLTGDEPALPVSRIAIAVIRRTTEHADFPCFLDPPQHAVVGDIAPQEESSVSEPDGAFGPATAGVQPLDGRIRQLVLLETGIDDFYRRIGIPDWSLGVLSTSEGGGFENESCRNGGCHVHERASLHRFSLPLRELQMGG